MSDSRLQEVQSLYDAKEFAKAYEIALCLRSDPAMDADTVAQATVHAGWCLFKLGSLDECITLGRQVDSVSAKEMIAQAIALRGQPDDQAELDRLFDELGGRSHALANAIMLAGLNGKGNAGYLEKVANRYRSSIEGCTEKLRGQILNNALRVQFDFCDYKLACEYGKLAIDAYEREAERTIDSRAAACFWISRAYELDDDLENALHYAEKSFDLWTAQCELVPDNAVFASKKKNAEERVVDLKQRIVS